MVAHLLLDTTVTGVPYVLPFLGVFVGFRLLDRIDLTIDASFVLGAAVTAVALGADVSPWVALVAAAAAGAAAGLVTTALHLLLRVPVLLAGIVMWIGLYSINLRVMGRPTLAVASITTIYAPLDGLGRSARDLWAVGILTSIVAAVVVAVAAYLRSESGLALRATGVNTMMARSQGVDDRLVVLIGLAAANSLAALGGALVAQGQGFAEVNMGTGVVIAGVAAVLIGELLVRPAPSAIVGALAAVVVGTLAYRFVLLVALRIGLPASDLRLVTAVTLGLTLAARRARGRVRTGVARSRTPRAVPGPKEVDDARA
ncbi:MAG: ABC transporter permease [Actinomycetota bacterium]|nr:ABC transporter permease [Actinomycetota bacterium]